MLLSALVACSVDVNGIRFGGPVVEESREVPTFHGVRAESGVDVVAHVEEGPQQVIVRASEDELGSVVLSVVDGVLVVSSRSGSFGGRSVEVHVPSLDRAEVTSVGDVTADGLNGGGVVVRSEGSGDVVLTGRVTSLDVQLASVGSATVDGIDGPVKARIDSSGDVTLRGRVTGLEARLGSTGDLLATGVDAEQVSVSLDSSGDVELRGRADLLSIELSSVGDVDASGLEIRDANVRSSGSGDVVLVATGIVSGSLTSVGDLTVSGGAKVNVRTTSTGDVRID
ncbi:MAG: DUF2807 domain-containing protein [Myxococcales bacterium]|nr:DUF2807 domain-containing protein [Myxococcales bacterium]